MVHIAGTSRPGETTENTEDTENVEYMEESKPSARPSALPWQPAADDPGRGGEKLLLIPPHGPHYASAMSERTLPLVEPEIPAFEQLIERLEAIVEQLESGHPTLEQALSLFEEGVRLTRDGTRSLEDAERRIERQLEDGRREKLQLDVEAEER